MTGNGIDTRTMSVREKQRLAAVEAGTARQRYQGNGAARRGEGLAAWLRTDPIEQLREDAAADRAAMTPDEKVRERREQQERTAKALKPEQQGEPEVVLPGWPKLNKAAMHGLVGKIAELATRNSEADPVAVMATTLVYAAAQFGRARFVHVGDSVHHSRHFSALVGRSARARKGTSFVPVNRVFQRAEEIIGQTSSLPFPLGNSLQVSHGPLSSGEGLIYAVRDKVIGTDKETGEMKTLDEGVEDKRLLVVEEELGSALRSFQRTGNNLSMIIRRAFDGGTLAPMTKRDRLAATGPHINVLGHVTRHELKDLMAGTEIWNGFANRFLWFCVKRQKLVPFPKRMPDAEVEAIAAEVAEAIMVAHQAPGELAMSEDASALWGKLYPETTKDVPGIMGAVTARQEAHVQRLALTYAQLDTSSMITTTHLKAAVAVSQYAFDSAAYLFGESELDPIGQKIVEALAESPKTQSQILREVFQRNIKATKLALVLQDLQERDRIAAKTTGEGPKETTLWSLMATT